MPISTPPSARIPTIPSIPWSLRETLVELAAHPKVVAIGETGLDYYRLKGDLEWQRERFRAHIRAAKACGKPLVIHTRAAAEDTLRIMREEGAGEAGGVMHCFTETWETAQAALDAGISHLVLGNRHVQERRRAEGGGAAGAARAAAGRDRFAVSRPGAHRGKTNRPAWVRYVAEELARLRGLTLDEIAAATSRNFFRLFAIEDPARASGA